MALVAFLRGINVGGHRSFRPSVLAKQLAHYDVVSIGATGTFVIRRPITRTKLRAGRGATVRCSVRWRWCPMQRRRLAWNTFRRIAVRSSPV